MALTTGRPAGSSRHLPEVPLAAHFSPGTGPRLVDGGKNDGPGFENYSHRRRNAESGEIRQEIFLNSTATQSANKL
jgi:hypothetical protein